MLALFEYIPNAYERQPKSTYFLS